MNQSERSLDLSQLYIIFFYSSVVQSKSILYNSKKIFILIFYLRIWRTRIITLLIIRGNILNLG